MAETEPAFRYELELDPVEILESPQVRSYLVGILSSDLPPEGKYQRFIDLFARERQIRDRVAARLGGMDSGSPAEFDKVLGAVMQELRLWEPERISAEVAQSLERALRWLARVQNPDGGWTILGETQSVFWETAFSTLCLQRATQLDEETLAGPHVEISLRRGIEWLNLHTEGWNFHYPGNELLPVYNVALAALCFREIGAGSFTRNYASTINAGLTRLLDARCPDGGWRSRSWDRSATNLKDECVSEPGATSFGIRACLAASEPPADRGVVEQAVQCLIRLRNPDGSWNGFDDRPSVSKTCDGVLGLVAAARAGIAGAGAVTDLDTTVNWLQSQEKPVLRDGVIEGWAWDYLPELIDPNVFEEFIVRETGDADERLLRSVYLLDERMGKYRVGEQLGRDQTEQLVKLFVACGYGYDYIGTCLTLEALVKLGTPALPALVSNCKWLIENQSRSVDPAQDGGWVTSTARISLALAEYYARLRAEF
jgi:hypothetical protein